VELTANDSSKLPPKALISSTSWDTNPHFSPDGTRIVFHSMRSGTGEIWACDSDGTKPLQLTDMKAKSTGSPRWSPGGKRVAFDSTRDGSSDIYLVGAEGGPVRRITAETTEEVIPRWSRDGRWIYVGSNRSGDWQIWKMPSEGGKAIQITGNGGFEGHESADGQYLYYHPYPAQKKGVRRVPSSGGPETLVLEAVHNWGFWDLTVKGIYFIDDSAKPVATISFYDLATRRVKSLAPVHGDPGFFVDNGFSVSPDGKWLLYSGGIPTTSDIMLIENFR
jgi:Tol biopolymer transport system component